MRKRNVLIAAGAAIACAILFVMLNTRSRAANTAAESAQPEKTSALVAGPGQVEPVSENILIGSELSGKLKSVNVEEGDHVRRGQILAVLENGDYLAQVHSAAAQVEQREAALRKVINGARTQERSAAHSTVREAQAVMDNASSELRRHQKLYAAGVISREEFETYQRESDVARARYEEAAQNYSLIDDHAREEDVSAAQADLASAGAQWEDARARYQKTVIRSPIDGVVLRKHHRNGESVSNSSTVPDPILTIGDTNTLRVRMDVDETDVDRVHPGQTAYVTADAYHPQKFWGRVVRVGNQLGPKNVHTDQPSERVDTKILETLIELAPGTQLPVGLRVDAYIVSDGDRRAMR
jgi:HlyD family secretion protein